MLSKIKGLVKSEEGQGMIEYGLIIAVVAVFLVAGLILLRDQISDVFSSASTTLSEQTAE